MFYIREDLSPYLYLENAKQCGIEEGAYGSKRRCEKAFRHERCRNL